MKVLIVRPIFKEKVDCLSGSSLGERASCPEGQVRARLEHAYKAHMQELISSVEKGMS